MKQGRVYKFWTQHEIDRVKNEVIMAADTNAILNYEEIAEMFGRTISSVEHVVNDLRKQGKLPKFCRNNQQEKYRSLYSKSEKKMIASLIEQKYTFEEIAMITGRTRYGIEGFWRNNGYTRQRKWTHEEETALLQNIKFDSYGVVDNYEELQRLFNRGYDAIKTKIYDLRKKGRLPEAKRTGMPEEKREEFKRYANRFFTKSV